MMDAEIAVFLTACIAMIVANLIFIFYLIEDRQAKREQKNWDWTFCHNSPYGTVVGGYNFGGGLLLCLCQKPWFIHRFFMRLLFNIKWVDKKLTQETDGKVAK